MSDLTNQQCLSLIVDQAGHIGGYGARYDIVHKPDAVVAALSQATFEVIKDILHKMLESCNATGNELPPNVRNSTKQGIDSLINFAQTAEKNDDDNYRATNNYIARCAYNWRNKLNENESQEFANKNVTGALCYLNEDIAKRSKTILQPFEDTEQKIGELKVAVPVLIYQARGAINASDAFDPSIENVLNQIELALHRWIDDNPSTTNKNKPLMSNWVRALRRICAKRSI